MTFQKFVVCSDIHGDKQDASAVKAFFNFCKSYKPQIRVIAGDLWDFRAIRNKASEEEKRDSMIEDFRMGMEFMRRLVPTHFLRGNHDERLWDLAKLDKGLVSDYAKEGVSQIEAYLKSIKCTMLPYDARLGVLRLGHLKVLHGYFCGQNATRQHALVYGSCLFGHVHCFPQNTEILTRRGWKSRDDLIIGEDVMSYNIGERCAEWSAMNNIVDLYHDGDMIDFRANDQYFSVTPYHDMVSSGSGPRWEYSYNKHKAHDLLGKHFWMKMGATNTFEDYPISDELLKIIGWIITEGCFEITNGHKYISIAQSDKPKVSQDHIVAILERLKAEYPDLSWKTSLKHKAGERKNATTLRYDAYRIRIHAGSLANAIFRLIPSKEMEYWMLNLSMRQSKMLIDQMVLADGSFYNGGLNWQYSSISKKNADIFQILCCMSGFRCSILFRANRGTNGIYSCSGCYHSDKKFLPPTKSRHTGMVWCPVVPRNQTVFARQNGRVIITGNCIDEAPIAGLERRVARCIGCLSALDFDYDRAKPSRLRHAHGWAFGIINVKTGNYNVWQSECIDGEWIMPTDFKRF